MPYCFLFDTGGEPAALLAYVARIFFFNKCANVVHFLTL